MNETSATIHGIPEADAGARLITGQHIENGRVVTSGSELFVAPAENTRAALYRVAGDKEQKAPSKLGEITVHERQQFANQELYVGALVAEYCMDVPMIEGGKTVRDILFGQTEQNSAQVRLQFYSVLEEVYRTIGSTDEQFAQNTNIAPEQKAFALTVRKRLKALNTDPNNADTLVSYFIEQNKGKKKEDAQTTMREKLRKAFDMKSDEETQIIGLSAYALGGIEYMHRKIQRALDRPRKSPEASTNAPTPNEEVAGPRAEEEALDPGEVAVPTTELRQGEQKEKKKSARKDTTSLLAYYLYEKRTSGNAETDKKRAEAQLSLASKDRAYKARLSEARIERDMQEESPHAILVGEEILKRIGQKGGQAEQAGLSGENAHVTTLEAWKKALEESKRRFVSLQEEINPTQPEIEGLAHTIFLARVEGAGADDDWMKARVLARQTARVRAYDDIHNLGFSLEDITLMGKMKDVGEEIRKINARNAELGLPPWEINPATKRYVGYAAKQAEIIRHQLEAEAEEEAMKDVHALYLQNIARIGLQGLRTNNVSLDIFDTTHHLSNEDMDSFIDQNNLPKGPQTYEFVLALHEAVKDEKIARI